ncbi:MAG: DUF4386 domain-containing protein [Candidatus Hodarchaeales archaeon]
MNQGLSLSRRLCARNAGFAITIRLLIGFFVFLSLNTLFEVPGEATLIAAKSIKDNVLLFLILVIAILIISFFTLMAAVALNNVLKSVSKDMSKTAAVLRVEGLFFVISMILLFIGISSFNIVLFLGHFLYAFYLILVGYLVIKSGYINRFLGIFLVIGGSMGYLIEGLIYFLLPSFEWIAILGIMIAVIAEFVLGITLVAKAIQLSNELPDPKRTITKILEEIGEATTKEIIDEVSRVARSPECKDRIPGTLVALEKDKKVVKRISKERKAIVWKLVT